MGNKLIVFLFVSIIAGSCVTPVRYLPTSSTIDVNQYGSYIEVSAVNPPVVKGELIAIDSNTIVVLSEETSVCEIVDMYQVSSFKLRYANPKNYGWTIPTSVLASAVHGALGIITVPINLVVSIAVTAAGNRAFTYSEANMTFDKIRMFARFPQGMPPGINTSSIK